MQSVLFFSPFANRMTSGLRAGFAIWALGACLGGCASEGAGDTRRELLESWTAGLIVPMYAQFEDRAGALATSVDALCAAPADAELEASRAAWMATREPLKRAEVFAFGPYSRPEFRIGPKIDSWPARPEDAEQRIAGTEPVDPDSLASLGIWYKGLPLIEYFLYSPEASTLTQFAVPRRCEYLKSVAAELVSRAHEIHMAWAPEGGNFANQLSGAGRTSTAWRTLRDAFGEIVNRMGFTIENVRRDKLGRPLGEMTGNINPEVVESRFSGRSIRDIQDNLSGIELLYFGDAASNVAGVSTYATERGQNFDDAFRTALSAARAALDAVDVTLAEAVSSEPDRVQEASVKLGELQSLIQVQMIAALGLSLNFNDNDGD